MLIIRDETVLFVKHYVLTLLLNAYILFLTFRNELTQVKTRVSELE